MRGSLRKWNAVWEEVGWEVFPSPRFPWKEGDGSVKGSREAVGKGHFERLNGVTVALWCAHMTHAECVISGSTSGAEGVGGEAETTLVAKHVFLLAAEMGVG